MTEPFYPCSRSDCGILEVASKLRLWLRQPVCHSCYADHWDNMEPFIPEHEQTIADLFTALSNLVSEMDSKSWSAAWALMNTSVMSGAVDPSVVSELPPRPVTTNKEPQWRLVKQAHENGHGEGDVPCLLRSIKGEGGLIEGVIHQDHFGNITCPVGEDFYVEADYYIPIADLPEIPKEETGT